MLDTSYGFNNLLKEVSMHRLFRAINISQASKKLFLRISMHVKKLALKLSALLDLMVNILFNI
jgi:hypothetical protein